MEHAGVMMLVKWQFIIPLQASHIIEKLACPSLTLREDKDKIPWFCACYNFFGDPA
jgi:hypothetical protein